MTDLDLDAIRKSAVLWPHGSSRTAGESVRVLCDEVERLRTENNHLRNPSQGEQVTLQYRLETMTAIAMRQRATIDAVRALHVRDPLTTEFYGDFCACNLSYPCPTIRALDAALAGGS